MTKLDAYQITNVSNPAAIGMQWVEPESKSDFQLVFHRIGTNTVWMGYRKAGGKLWSTFAVVDPDRFGDFPRTEREALEYTRKFIEAENS